jgi:hypothetical protein
MKIYNGRMKLLQKIINWIKKKLNMSEKLAPKEGARQLVEIIDSYTATGKEMLKKFADPDRQLLYQTRTLILLLERVTYNSLSIKLNLEEYIRSGNEHYEYSMGLLFRNICSDIITLCYINHLGFDKKFTTEQIEDWTKDLLAGEIITAVTYFKFDKVRDVLLTEDEKKEQLDTYLHYCKEQAKANFDLLKLDANGELAKLNEDFVDHEGFTIKGYKVPEGTVNKTTPMMKSIHTYLYHFKHLDVLWKGYSQYEHIGGLTYGLTRLDFKSKIHDMSHSIYNIIQANKIFAGCIMMPSFDNDTYTTKADETMKIYLKYFSTKQYKK